LSRVFGLDRTSLVRYSIGGCSVHIIVLLILVTLEFRRALEHMKHGGDARDVPCTDVLLERRRRLEHNISPRQ
jgi:hypothetical protein